MPRVIIRESTEPLKVGDVVQLKSGGPPMTIVAGDDEAGWACVWFHENAVDAYRFGATALATVEIIDD